MSTTRRGIVIASATAWVTPLAKGHTMAPTPFISTRVLAASSAVSALVPESLWPGRTFRSNTPPKSFISSEAKSIALRMGGPKSARSPVKASTGDAAATNPVATAESAMSAY